MLVGTEHCGGEGVAGCGGVTFEQEPGGERESSLVRFWGMDIQ